MNYLKFERGQGEIHYLELGEARGTPVLFFHGFPGSATQGLIFQPHLETQNLFVIAPERPGYGNSTAAKAPGYRKFLEDCLALMRAKGFERFHVVGLSGGGPYARAMAKLAPESVISCHLLAGLGVLDKAGLAGMRRAERVLLAFFKRAPEPVSRHVLRTLTRILKPKRLIAHLIKTMPAPDRAQLHDPQVQQLLLESFVHGLRQREHGIYFDIYNYLNGDDEIPGLIRCPVVFYHGGVDTIVPVGMSEALHKTIPGAELIVLPDEGHYSLAVRGALPCAIKLRALS